MVVTLANWLITALNLALKIISSSGLESNIAAAM